MGSVIFRTSLEIVRNIAMNITISTILTILTTMLARGSH